MAELIIALDFSTSDEVIALARILAGHVQWVKVGLESYIASGPEIIYQLKKLNYRIFLDLKLHDIPNTVGGILRAAIRLGVDMLSVHIMGGANMLAAAHDIIQNETAVRYNHKLWLMGVTVLTSLTIKDIAKFMGHAFLKKEIIGSIDNKINLSRLILTLAQEAYNQGLDGVICSAWEVAHIKATYGYDFICLTPGIRLKNTTHDDHARVATPGIAVAQGADFIVVGRPVVRSTSPIDVVFRILKEISTV